ncbi:helix-turn-helix domain-containing protein [Paenibacillus sp. NPDC056579]|uniref:helix-turn-helix domain-containing protein n=1 Tax=Paenibacillus sp. NPDC056579 TaxID=3345871 RepID=UPI0036751774
MENSLDYAKQLASYSYKLENVQHLTLNEAYFQQDSSLNGMLIFLEGEGDLTMDGRSYPLRQQKVFLLSPNSDAKLSVPLSRRADYYYIQFYVLQAADRGLFVPIDMNAPYEVYPPHFHILIDKVQEMDTCNHSSDSWENMKAAMLLQELIVILFKESVAKEKRESSEAIPLTLEYMERNYPLAITREKLAEIAGLNADYFSRAFKKQFHKSPMEYLNEIRINQAKQLLVQSGESLRSIAQSVGFSDEYYFSRKFKEEIGCSPRSYSKKMKETYKIASLNHQTTGHLIALGIVPYAAVINHAYPVTSRLRNTIALGRTAPDLDRLVTSNPDIIVMSGTRQAVPSPNERLMLQIAPTITLQYGLEWRAHFLSVAKLVNKESEAIRWLEKYESKASMIRSSIRSRIGDEPILILGVGEGTLCVYGHRNLGSVLYGDLQMTAPEGVRGITHFMEVLPEHLHKFEAARILVTSFRHNGTAHMDQMIRHEVKALYANPHWLDLKAVRNKRVYGMYDSHHLYTSYNPLSHQLFLDKVHQLLMSESADPLLLMR